VNLVPHIFHKGHIHGFALPLSSTSTLIFSYSLVILYHDLGVNVKCLMQINANICILYKKFIEGGSVIYYLIQCSAISFFPYPHWFNNLFSF